MTVLRKPPPLRPPAVIGVPAPASPVRKELVERGVGELERLGFRVRLSERLYRRARYTAGSPEDRLADWLELWEDPEVSAIFCARGGYGAMELLPGLPSERLRQRPKIVLGSSDVTALHAFLASQAQLVSFHGPMVAQQIARQGYDSSQLFALLGSPEPRGRIDSASTETLHRGTAEGVLFGGCLSLVTALVGTPYLPSFRGAILFLEDTQVKPYQIDRMLTQLRLAGLLEGIRGLVFGEMPECDQHPNQGYSLQELLRDWTAPLGVPVLFGLPSGHTRGGSLTLPLGIRCRIDGDGLTLLEAAVL